MRVATNVHIQTGIINYIIYFYTVSPVQNQSRQILLQGKFDISTCG